MTTMTTAYPHRVRATFAVFVEKFRHWRAERQRSRLLRRTRIELSSLPDRTLRDIGLTRGEIGGFDPADSFRRGFEPPRP
jgi:uncharacterized protein YjiS (DUF1127 family)